jgi:hypothetical protein
VYVCVVTHRHHEAGNVGVEHAALSDIKDAIEAVAPGFAPGRAEFSMSDLQNDGLAGYWDLPDQVGL